jgi:hypothetical protein
MSKLRCCAVALTIAVTLVVPAHAGATTAGAFPVGWYDELYGPPSSLHGIATEPTDTVMPYGDGLSAIQRYLNRAAAEGVSVYVPIDRTLIADKDADGVAAFVDALKDSPAVAGWYLADEPTLSGSMTPSTGVLLYDAIKSVDPRHPVAIGFYFEEDAAPYTDAMDVIFWDWFPEYAGSAAFSYLTEWHRALVVAARSWQVDKRFVPIVQAFGGTEYPAYRLPTALEERYMVYSALQSGVDGMFFWSRYAADPAWRLAVLDPLLLEVHSVLPAIEAGPLRVAGSDDGVEASLYLNPVSGTRTLLIVNNADTPLRARISLLRHHVIRATFAPFEVRVLRFPAPVR